MLSDFFQGDLKKKKSLIPAAFQRNGRRVALCCVSWRPVEPPSLCVRPPPFIQSWARRPSQCRRFPGRWAKTTALPSLSSTSSSCSGTTPSPFEGGGRANSKRQLNERANGHKIIKKAIRKPSCLTPTFSRSLAAVSPAVITCGCCVPSAAWRLPVFP